MKITELIKNLEKIKNKHGNDLGITMVDTVPVKKLYTQITNQKT